MLETEFQNETTFAEQAQLTPVDQLRQQWLQQPGTIALIKQKNVIDQNAELMPHAGSAGIEGWLWPYSFAFQGLVVAALLTACFTWYLTRHSGRLEDDILRLQENVQTETQRQQGIMDATQAEIRRISRAPKSTFKLHMSDHILTREEALSELNATFDDTNKSLEQYKLRAAERERDLRAREGVLAIVNSGSPLIFVLALVFAAGGVRRGMQRSYSRNRYARNSGDLYLYFATAEGLWLNLVFLAFLHFALSGNALGMGDFSQVVGPIFWTVFWLGFYLLLLWYFMTVARDLYAALQLRPPKNEWSTENRILLKIHNSFLLVFLEMEIPFIAACYLLYETSKRLS